MRLVLLARRGPRVGAGEVADGALRGYVSFCYRAGREGRRQTSVAPLMYSAWAATRPGWFWVLGLFMLEEGLVDILVVAMLEDGWWL